MTFPDTIEIEVTARDIADAVGRDCPIVQAVRKLYPIADISIAGSLYIETDDWESNRFGLPEAALDFMDRFDAGKEVEPFRFTARKEVPVQIYQVRR